MGASVPRQFGKIAQTVHGLQWATRVITERVRLRVELAGIKAARQKFKLPNGT